MDEVFPDLYVGSMEDAGDQSLCRTHEIDRIVSLTFSDPEGGFPPWLPVEKSPMMDGPRNDEAIFASAVEDVLTALEVSECVLVHCSRGSSRSPSVAATAAAIYEETELAESFRKVQHRRPETDPHDAVVRKAVAVFADFT
ncbi:dual specificity protein phosphatase family protein [Halobellus clavatus]|jgi:atypical dual specificity phosphatase|uniref:Dual specificity phosphatase, catalytic domain n=1 Tax=Halobellus clavatus TaxID=660517 RepID=A0A1H3FWX5_9EURY|nr:dual specificity protein phosphatase [Halobellus clavatus]SDX95287.1 Dual specificity phosphatase, catalytic domain [Halobellus clavatus]